ncbi:MULTISPECIES: carboxy terminal-processing peptidase [unclassified Massilia]|uniref:carboxy terminal-processing peptidase n=1 Tax=unclassified Massilia TaxID=2609279 RepID=UPI0017869D7C|nr:MULTISPECIES: carboxy terminal-processing peptidase [unclassified Massilia]MBD8531598.1 carboxy terminal-processing peptidase [Massilia sp. CFBP 13647]MBD8673606.1 carboxy terminal-processing peptidase [Massilia sp. CFBP 13721]
MKKQMLIVALAAACALSTHAVTAQPEKVASTQMKPIAAQTQAALWASRVLGRYHYKATPLDDAMSEKIFDNYFQTLDGEKLYFTQADLDRFAPMRTKFDDAINNEDLTQPFAIYNLYQQRFAERMNYARSLLKTKLDFTVDETLQLDREKAPWAKSEDEVRDLWRKRVKNDWLRLKLAGKDEKGIRETLDKRYDNYVSRMKKLNNEDVFQMFMNAYATAIEPHTNYLGPRSADNFDIAMRLSLEGIGAVLQTRDDYTVIREIVPGSPADKSGKLKVGDRIVGVAQGTGAFTDVLGWRIDDVVQLVRGEKGSTVRLDVIPGDAGVDAKHVTVSMVRKKISMEEQAAKKSIIQVKEGGVNRRIGIISLPTFYQDFEARRKGDKDFKSATRDVARILGELKKEKVDNVLIDLRNNGGGSLTEAVELTGLFIDKGPVVQQRTAEGRVEVESDTQAGLAWDGPMGVLINRGSASASEIFAAAIQDYGRGLVIGEPSFGKGTVQTLIDLDRFSQSEKVRYGELKMTIAQFFRINGGTTQLRGVTPDIKLPVTTDPDSFGESSFDNALPWVSIKPATYIPSGDLKELVAPLQKRHEARIAKDKEFQDLREDIAEVMKLRKENAISLNEAVRRKERDTQDARAKMREARLAAAKGSVDEPVAAPGGKEARSKVPEPTRPAKAVVAARNALRDDGLQGDERALSAEIAAEKAAKDAKDVLLQEAAHILADEAGMLKTDTRMASRTMPYMASAKPE